MNDKVAFIYWDTETGGIYAATPTKLENPKTDNPPLEIPMAEAIPFLTGVKRLHKYYVSTKNQPIIKKKSDFRLSDISRANKLYKLPKEDFDWDPGERILKIEPDEDMPIWLKFYVTKKDNPYHLIQTLPVTQKISARIDTGEEDISVFTTNWKTK